MNIKNKLEEFIKRGEFFLAGGQKSDIYLDLKEAYGNPEILNFLADAIYEKIDKKTTCIVALGLGGIPIASVLSSKYNLKLTLIRDELKNHGIPKLIEGYIPESKDKITIIDDVFTKGTNLNKIITALKQTEAEILGACVVVKRGEGQPKTSLKYLFTLEELLDN